MHLMLLHGTLHAHQGKVFVIQYLPAGVEGCVKYNLVVFSHEC